MKDKNPEIKEPSIPYGKEYTYGDYLKFGYEEMVELIRGKIYKMSPAPATIHQRVAGNLHGFIWTHFKEAICTVFIAPFDVILPIPNVRPGKSSNTVVQPDICVICDDEKIKEQGCFGAPDLVIEVLSPGNSRKDITLKHEVYEESKVKEYWIVYPRDTVVHKYVLVEDKYVKPEISQGNEIITSHVFPSLSIDLKEVFQNLHAN